MLHPKNQVDEPTEQLISLKIRITNGNAMNDHHVQFEIADKKTSPDWISIQNQSKIIKNIPSEHQ